MHFSFADIVGFVGVFLVIMSFFLLQIGKCRADSGLYLFANFFGATFLLYSLYYSWNTASVIIELLWLSISVVGIIKYKVLIPRKTVAKDSEV